jgi:hypothetical protein
VARQNMRFVPIKTDEQLDLQALHRVRDRLVQRRTAVINQIRGFLIERGITFPKRAGNLRNNMVALLEDAEANLSPRSPGQNLAKVTELRERPPYRRCPCSAECGRRRGGSAPVLRPSCQCQPGGSRPWRRGPACWSRECDPAGSRCW